MRRTRRPKPLPLPKSWLPRLSREEAAYSLRDQVVSGRMARVGTKDHFRSLLLRAGWDQEQIDPVLSGKYKVRERLKDLAVEVRGTRDDAVVSALARLTKEGHKPTLLPRRAGSSLALQEMWDSYTRQPWWTAVGGGQRTIIVAGSNANMLSRTSAAFVRDVWVNLGEGPESRLPTIRRLNLLSWASTEALNKFENTVGLSTDIAVVYGGLLDEDHIHTTFSYLGALASVFGGICLYEAAIPDVLSPEALLASSRRAGFSLLLGVGDG